MLLSIVKHKVNTFSSKLHFQSLKGKSKVHVLLAVSILLAVVSVYFDSGFLKSPFAVNPNRLFDCQ